MQYESGAAIGRGPQSPASQYNPVAEKQPSRFSLCAAQLEDRVAHITGLFDRVSRATDRLGGSVPEEAQIGKQIQGAGGNVASVIEQTLETLDVVIRRAERTVERLESL